MVNVTSRPTLDKCFSAGFLKELQAILDNHNSHIALRGATLNVTGL